MSTNDSTGSIGVNRFPGRWLFSPLSLSSAAVLLLPLMVLMGAAVPTPAGRPGVPEDNPVLEAGLKALREGDPTMAVTLLRSSAASEKELSPEAWLGLGVAYHRMGRPVAAREAFEHSAGGLPDPLPDWIDYFVVGLRYEMNEPAEADSLLYRLGERGLPDALARRVREAILERAIATRDVEREQAALNAMITAYDPGAATAALHLGRLLAAGDPARARELYRQAFTLPGSDEARGECAELLMAEGELEAPELLAAGRIFSALAGWERAREAFTRVRDTANDPDLVAEAEYRYGLCLLRERRYTEARRVLAGVEQGGGRFRTSAGYNGALAAAALSRREGARDLVAFTDRYPTSQWAPRALKQAGDRMSGVDPAAAEEIYVRLVREYPRHWENAGVLFELGRNALEQGDREEARRWFTTLGGGVFHPEEKSQGWYWAARAAEADGDSTAAAALFRRAAEGFPGTWYGVLAGRARSEEPPVPVLTPRGNGSDLKVPAWADPALTAGIILLRVGLGGDGGEEQLLDALEDRAQTGARSLELWNICVEGHAWGAARRLGDRLLRGGTVDQADPLYEDLLFPVYYHDLIESTARRYGVDPWLIFALVRQESAFDAGARSYAGARGLMQLMPETATEWAGRLRMGEVGDEDLYDPALNIALAVPYLARLIDRFGGSVEKALAAYNGGATNVRRWERSLPDDRPETFVESIGYSETRTFVRTIMNNYHRYRFLWSEKVGG